MEHKQDLEELALVSALILAANSDLLKDFMMPIASSSYNPNFRVKNVKRIDNLKYTRNHVFCRTSSFYRQKI